MGSDWFRKQSWSQVDQEDFQRRLARARDYNKAQYIFIQGLTLMEIGDQYIAPAISLFDLVIERYPQSLNFVQALTAKASCFQKLGDTESALNYYWRATEQRRLKPNVETWAWLDFAWLVASEEISDRYDAALGVLNEFGNQRQLFPVIVFRRDASRALILSARGLTDVAADAARIALAAADKEVSELRYHPTLGVVGSKYENIRTRLKAIAAPASPKSAGQRLTRIAAQIFSSKR